MVSMIATIVIYITVGVVLLGMTMGQTLCVGMILAGMLAIYTSRKSRELAEAA